MESNPPIPDPKSIWQSQPTHASDTTPKLTLVLMQQKARALHAKTRQELFNNALAHLAILVFCGVGVARGHGLAQRGTFFAAVAWALAGAWLSRRAMRSRPLPGDAGLETGVAFYRQEIQRRGLLFRRTVLWYLGPILLALGALIVPFVITTLAADPGRLRQAIPFVTLLLIWFVALWAGRRRRKLDLQREFGELEEIERETRSP